MGEESGDYCATSAQPDEWYTQVANRFMEAAYSEFGLAATRCFLYLIRCTKGFHQDAVSLTVDEFCHGKRTSKGRLDEGTKLTRVSVLAGLAELREKHIITVAISGRGRGREYTYTINATHLWRLSDSDTSIGKESIPIQNGKATIPISDSIGKGSIPIPADNGKDAIPMRVPRGRAASGTTRTGKKDQIKKDSLKETDADASGAATSAAATPSDVTASEILSSGSSQQRASPPTSRASRRTPKLTGEALEAHRAEQAYVGQVLNAYIQRLGASVKLANPGRERNAAHWFYTAKDGQPVPVEEIMDCYDITKQTSFWRTKPLSLMKLKEYWLEYQADPAEYRAANGGNNGTRTNPGGSAASSTGRTASTRKAEPVVPDPTADGEYAAFIRAKQTARAARTQGERGSHTPTS